MKTMKKAMALLLATLLVLSLSFSVLGAETAGISDFSVIATVKEKEIKIDWWKGSGKYYLFLPADADLKALKVDYNASAEVTLEGEVLTDESEIALQTQKDYTLSCDGKEYVLEVLKSDKLPSMHITTKSGSMDAVHADKEHKEEASLVILSEGDVLLEKDLEYIKGRGNATWTYSKKPYNIKFDKKTDLFGMGKAKKWTLLANYIDQSVMRNHVALNLAQELEIPFTSEHIYVDLYINNEYYGNYILCESVEVGETRVDINDLEGATEEANPDIELDECTPGGDRTTNYRSLKAGTQKWYQIPNDPEDITGGYLLEYELPDRYVNEASGFITNNNQTIVIKSPEYASEAQVKYISALYQKFEDAVYSETGYNAEGKHYSEYIDLPSFVRMYVFQEYTKNLDAAITSFYIYKDTANDKFVAAPVWDFDNALGSSLDRFGMKLETPTGWWAGVIYNWAENAIKTLPTVLNALYRHDDFFALASEEWNTFYPNLITEEFIAELSDFADELTPSAAMNSIRWNRFSATDYNGAAAAYRNFVDSSLLNFIKERKNFLDKGFSDTIVRVFYNANGGYGNMFNEGALQLSESFTLPKCSFTHSSLEFDSWNTKADGSGTSYNAGDSLTLENTKITFYAQWKEKPQPPAEPEKPVEPEKPTDNEKELNFFEKIIKSIRDFFERIRNFFENLFR